MSPKVGAAFPVPLPWPGLGARDTRCSPALPGGTLRGERADVPCVPGEGAGGPGSSGQCLQVPLIVENHCKYVLFWSAAKISYPLKKNKLDQSVKGSSVGLHCAHV